MEATITQEGKVTKIGRLLLTRQLSQKELQKKIKEKSGLDIGHDRISRFVTGQKQNVTIETALAMANALDVKIDDIID